MLEPLEVPLDGLEVLVDLELPPPQPAASAKVAVRIKTKSLRTENSGKLLDLIRFDTLGQQHRDICSAKVRAHVSAGLYD